MMPAVTLTSIVILFGIYAIADGVFAIAAAVRGIREKDPWGWMMVEGVLGITAGLVALLWPGIGGLTLTLLVGAWALATGTFEIAAAFKLRKLIRGEWILFVAGTLSVLLGFAMFARPAAGALVIVWWLGAYLLLYGALAFGFSLKMRRATRTLADASSGAA
jgi:uncharacterized membrane protein HdeD (DUF308 family)